MALNFGELRHCLHAATAAAYLAGGRVMRHYGRDIEVDSKGTAHLAGDVVTVADRDSQEAIFAVLKDFDPRIGMLSEESDVQDPSRFEKPYFWCVDPLDGTLPFIEGVAGFAVSIALVAQTGEPVIGVCFLPAYGDLYSAVTGQGAFKNGRPASFGPFPGNGTVTLSVNTNENVPPERHALLTKVAENLKALPGCKRVAWQTHSGAVAKGCRLLECAPAMYLGCPRKGNEGVSAWDLAAAACIVKEAGGVATDVFGAPLELNRRDSTYCHHRGFILASHPQLAAAAMAVLSH